jgi:hypothetical protein
MLWKESIETLFRAFLFTLIVSTVFGRPRNPLTTKKGSQVLWSLFIVYLIYLSVARLCDLAWLIHQQGLNCKAISTCITITTNLAIKKKWRGGGGTIMTCPACFGRSPGPSGAWTLGPRVQVFHVATCCPVVPARSKAECTYVTLNKRGAMIFCAPTRPAVQ